MIEFAIVTFLLTTHPPQLCYIICEWSLTANCDKYFVFRDVEKLHFIQIFVIAVVDTKDMLNMDKFAEDFACLKEICLDQGQL